MFFPYTMVIVSSSQWIFATLLKTHVARHTFATTVTLSNDVPIEVVARMLGHSSIRQTSSYAIVEENLISRHMEKAIIMINQ